MLLAESLLLLNLISAPYHSASALRGVDRDAMEQKLFSRATQSQKCHYETLKTLGITLDFEPGYEHRSTLNGQPCSGTDDELSKSRTLALPTKSKDVESEWKFFLGELESFKDADLALCAYKSLVERAGKVAMSKLMAAKAAGRYRFGTDEKRSRACLLPAPWAYADRGSHLEEDLKNVDCFVAHISPSRSVQCLYDRSCASECFVGLQIAQLATQYEIYGPQNFDQAFSLREISLGGGWLNSSVSKNPMHASNMQSYQSASNIKEIASREGRFGLVGFVLYLKSSYDKSFLDSPADIGENLVVVETSDIAAKDLAERGPEGVAKDLNEIWQIARFLEPEDFEAIKEYLADRTKPLALSNVSGSKAKMLKELIPLLTNSFNYDTRVYVHPLEVMSISQQIIRLAQINPRTPYQYVWYPNNINTEMYNRFYDFHYNKCIQAARDAKNTDSRKN